MKYIIDMDNFPELLQDFELDGVQKAYCRGRMNTNEKGDRIPCVEISAILPMDSNDVFYYTFQEIMVTPMNFNKMENETDEALEKRKTDFVNSVNRVLDEKYIRGLQGIRNLKVRSGSINVI